MDAHHEYLATKMLLHNCTLRPQKDIAERWWLVHANIAHPVEIRRNRETGHYHFDSLEQLVEYYCEFYNLVPTEVTQHGE